MGTTFIQRGDTLELTAPAGGVTKGLVYFIGGIPVVAVASASAGAAFQGMCVGVHSLPKATGTAWTEGQAVFWDAANARCDVDATVGLPIGAVATAAASGDATGKVVLTEIPFAGRILNVRKRFTIAQVNAGATLVPAVPGAKIRMVDASLISVGGAAAAVTTVDILGTLSTSRKLVAAAQASLTQSTVLKAGGAGAAVLADGASYTANDANTAVTVGITGAAITTATHIDVNFTYTLE